MYLTGNIHTHAARRVDALCYYNTRSVFTSAAHQHAAVCVNATIEIHWVSIFRTATHNAAKHGNAQRICERPLSVQALWTCSKVDEQIKQEDGVRHTVEDDPSRAVVVVEERYCYRKYDEICNQQHQHTTVPVKPTQPTFHMQLYSCKSV